MPEINFTTALVVYGVGLVWLGTRILRWGNISPRNLSRLLIWPISLTATLLMWIIGIKPDNDVWTD
jgi:hypothetical protein